MQNILGITSQQGELMVKYSYSAYGFINPITGSLANTGGAENPFRYKGYYYDNESGMYYCKSRYFIPQWGRWLNADNPSFLDTESLNGMNLFAYCINNPIVIIDPNGNMPNWLKWTLGAVVITGAIALSIATAGLAAPIAAGVGGGLCGAIVGGAVAGAIGGAIAGFGISVGMQGATNGFDEIDWNQVGKSTLSGAISGFVAGGVFGGIKHVVSASKVANSISGLSKAQSNLDRAFAPLKNVKSLSGMAYSGSNITRTVGQAATNYNAAYMSFVNAQMVNSIVKAVFYPVTQFLFKQAIGCGINQFL